MILYNVTINIRESIESEWLAWMQQKHIPDVLATGKFSSARLVKVLVAEEMGGVTYAVQYTTDSREKLESYYADDAPHLRKEPLEKFGDNALYFRTELQVVSEHYE